MEHRSRRQFLREVGRGMLAVSVGCGLASELDLGVASADEGAPPLNFGPLEPLVALLQETPIAKLIPACAERLSSGTSLRDLLAAGALANARTFGGEDYVGFHTMMALSPAYHMAQELPEPLRALPVLKVLYRNSKRMEETGGRSKEVLHVVVAGDTIPDGPQGEALREVVRKRDVETAERRFAALARRSTEEAFNDLLICVQDATEVHRVVLPYRAWDLLAIIGKEHAHTLLRQSLHYCLKSQNNSLPDQYTESQRILPKLFDQYHLLDKSPARREADDAWVDRMTQTFFRSTPSEAADAAAAVLAEGMSPDAVGEAIALAANQLVLRDHGRRENEIQPGKPLGSVHGDSIGVHASDSANAWRNTARVANPRNACASLILGAYQVALDRGNRGGDFLNWEPHPRPEMLEKVKSTGPDELLKEADGAIRENDQARAAAIVHRYGELGHPHRPVFDLLLRYATSEDGALHAEKYYRTVSEEFGSSRPAFRWRQLTALARVTASEYGRPAAGYAEAKEILKV